MKRRWTIAVLLAALAQPALAQGPPGGMMGTFQQEPLPALPHSYTVPPEPEARADDLRMQGRCNAAIPIYRALASQGQGYELAEFGLARCLLENAKKQSDPQAAAALQQEATQWTITAANNGLPNAQSALVSVYLDGVGVAADPVEAGKWSLLYHGNGARRLYGLPDNAPSLQARLDSVLNDKSWAVAKARADSWNPPPQKGIVER